MGQTLSEPSQDKRTTSGSNERLAFAVSEMQGWRISMEDAHATELDIDGTEHNSFFAVYDGHGGGTIARYSGQHVHGRLASDNAYAARDYTTAFRNAFLGTDDDLRADPSYLHDPSGCTAVAALVTANKIICANAGDSRAVLSIKGEAKPLSYDHKPSDFYEALRIRSAGGYVEFNRVNGNLALSRAIGDFEFKQNFSLPPEQQIVTSNPDVLVHDITEDDEFLVMACDGIWDCMSSQETVNWIRHHISEGVSLEKICEDCMTHCLSPDSEFAGGMGCDNMTILVVALLHGRTLDEWYDWVAERVEKNIGYQTPRRYSPLYQTLRFGTRAGPGSGLGDSGAPRGGWLNRLNQTSLYGNAGLPTFAGGGSSPGNDEDVDDEDDFEDDSGDELMTDGSNESLQNFLGGPELNGIVGGPVRLRAPPQRDETSSLRARLHDLDEDKSENDGDYDDAMDDVQSQASSDDQTPVLSISNSITNRQPVSIGSPIIASPPSLKDMRTPIMSNSEMPRQPQRPPKSTTADGPKSVEQHKSTLGSGSPSNAIKMDSLVDASGAPSKI